LLLSNYDTSCKVLVSNFSFVNDLAASATQGFIAAENGKTHVNFPNCLAGLFKYEAGYIMQITDVGQSSFISVAYYYDSNKQQDIIAAGTPVTDFLTMF
jgi:hypothetical protein